MIEAYKQAVMWNYANFDGRATRSQYWWFTLANLIIFVALAILAVVLSVTIGEIAFGILVIYWVAILLPSIAVTVRRLHDINKSAWWLLIGLIPWIGSIILLILMVLNTYPQPNQYGEPTGWQDAISTQQRMG